MDAYNYEDRQVRVAPFTQTTTVAVFNYETRQVRVAPFRQRVTVQPPCEWVTVYGQRVYYCPPPRTTWQAVYNYQTQSVRVAPFTETRTVAVFNYQTQRVRVAPFRETLTIPAYNYETQSVRVAPFTQTRTVARYNYETQSVRVAPFTATRTVDVFNYETQSVRVAPFTATRTVDVFNYETQSVRIAPFTQTLFVDVFNYETQQVRVAPFTETVTFTDPDLNKGTWRHDPSEHVCPEGQYMAPFPTIHAHLTDSGTRFDIYDEENQHGEQGRPVTEWVEMDAHTGCHRPVDPFPEVEDTSSRRTLWGDISNTIKSATNTAVTAAGLVIEPASSYLLTNYPSLYKALHVVVCAPESLLVEAAATTLAQRSAKVAEWLKEAKKGLAITGVAATITAAHYLVCKTGVDPSETTTTTLPPVS